MKVLLINNRHFRGGGADVVYFSTAEKLIEAGHQVTFFSRHSENALPDENDSFFIPEKSQYCIFTRTLQYFNNKDAAVKLEELLRKEHFDIAHAHLMWGGMTAAIIPVLHKYGVPIVHTVHDYRMVCPAYTFRNGRGKVCEKCKGGRYYQCIMCRCAKGGIIQSILMAAEMKYRNIKWHPAKEMDGVIYVSQFAKQKHEEIDPLFKTTPNTIIYNFTTVGEVFKPVENDGGYYLYYGRLSGEKGIQTLIDVFKRHPELHLKVVGNGPIEDELKRNLLPNVEFLGYKSGDELYNLVRYARFVCVPSEWYENNPMTIVEAYSMGVPVIGAKIGGIPEIVDEGKTGFLFESGSVDFLEETIIKSEKIEMQDYLQMKHNAIKFAHDYFNGKTYPDRLVDFYKCVINLYGKK